MTLLTDQIFRADLLQSKLNELGRTFLSYGRSRPDPILIPDRILIHDPILIPSEQHYPC